MVVLSRSAHNQMNHPCGALPCVRASLASRLHIRRNSSAQHLGSRLGRIPARRRPFSVCSHFTRLASDAEPAYRRAEDGLLL